MLVSSHNRKDHDTRKLKGELETGCMMEQKSVKLILMSESVGQIKLSRNHSSVTPPGAGIDVRVLQGSYWVLISVQGTRACCLRGTQIRSSSSPSFSVCLFTAWGRDFPLLSTSLSDVREFHPGIRLLLSLSDACPLQTPDACPLQTPDKLNECCQFFKLPLVRYTLRKSS